MGYKVAIAGATGNVGREMLDILAERAFPADEVVALASRRSLGQEVAFGDKTLKVKDLATYDFSDVDICLMSAGGTVSRQMSPQIAQRGAVVIDNSSAWRYDSDVPLIVPEVNADAVKGFTKRRIIANPNCSTAQLVVALKPLHDLATHQARRRRHLPVGVRRRQGRHGRTVPADARHLLGRRRGDQEVHQAHRLQRHPAYRQFMEDGYTKEEWKMMAETKKILDPKIKLTATCVRVPVFIGHSEAVNIEFEKPISVAEATAALRSAPGCVVMDKREDGGYITPHEAAGEDPTYISRIREDATVENGLSLWVVSDNLRKGAALNAVQIAEALINRGLITAKRKAA